jgi:hypothetical protein
MELEMRRENAKIKSTMLGIGDHGEFTFWLNLEGPGWGYGFGGMNLRYVKQPDALVKVLRAVGVSTWEELPGKHVRCELSEGGGGRVERVGHILEERWVSIADLLEGE